MFVYLWQALGPDLEQDEEVVSRSRALEDALANLA